MKSRIVAVYEMSCGCCFLGRTLKEPEDIDTIPDRLIARCQNCGKSISGKLVGAKILREDEFENYKHGAQ